MVQGARLQMRFLQLYFLPKWKQCHQNPDFMILVNQSVFSHLQWWTNLQNLLSGLPLSPPEHQTVLTTDASSLGWGGVLGEEKGGGEYTDGTGSVEHRGDGLAYQYAGTDGSMAIPPALPSTSGGQGSSGPVGQHNDLCIYQQERRYKVSNSVQDSSETLALVPGKTDCLTSCSCSGGRQCSCRLLVTPENRPKGMVPSCTCGSHSVQNVGEAPSGFICFNPQQEADQLLFMVPLPNSNEQGCFLEIGRASCRERV